jgi:hypothetical protein
MVLHQPGGPFAALSKARILGDRLHLRSEGGICFGIAGDMAQLTGHRACSEKVADFFDQEHALTS